MRTVKTNAVNSFNSALERISELNVKLQLAVNQAAAWYELAHGTLDRQIDGESSFFDYVSTRITSPFALIRDVRDEPRPGKW